MAAPSTCPADSCTASSLQDLGGHCTQVIASCQYGMCTRRKINGGGAAGRRRPARRPPGCR
jgi:hypothetical protein